MGRHSILCKLGIHKLDEVTEDYLKDACEYRDFNNRVYQKGVQKCTRDDCDFEKKVWRRGWHSNESGQIEQGGWEKLTPSMEARIDTMPHYMLM